MAWPRSTRRGGRRRRDRCCLPWWWRWATTVPWWPPAVDRAPIWVSPSPSPSPDGKRRWRRGATSRIRDPSVPPFPMETTARRGRHRQGRGVRRLTPRRWRAAACPTPMGLASGARCAAGADPPPRISSRRRASALGAIHCSPSSQGRLSLAREP